MNKNLPAIVTKQESDAIDILVLKTSDEEKLQLLSFINELIAIREQDISKGKKIKQTLIMYKKSKDVWPLVKNVKALLWDNRSTSTKIGLGVVVATAAFMPGNAGIAAFGTAVGVPLWVVIGSGYAFAKLAAEKFKSALQKSDIYDAAFTVIKDQ